jgi:threonine/homoserine/homoserine lactone efflux protein
VIVDPVFVEAMVLGLACAAASFALGLVCAVAEIQLRAWLQRRREARRLREERDHG